VAQPGPAVVGGAAPPGIQPQVPGVPAMQPGQVAALFNLFQQFMAQQQPQVPLPPIVQPPITQPVPIVAQYPPVIPNQPAPFPIIPGPFSLYPGRRRLTPLDFGLDSDVKIFNHGTEPLEDKFDLSSSGLNDFLCRVKDRSIAFFWDDVFNVPDASGVPRSLFMEYGMVTQADCRRHAESYCHSVTLIAQNAVMSQQFLLGSFSKEARDARVYDTSATTRPLTRFRSF
jgi:hypothetical protein